MHEVVAGRGSSSASGTGLVRALLAADRLALDAELADRPRFDSPIRGYDARPEVVHLLALIGSILPGAQIERSWPGPGGAATIISATVDGARLDGVVEELYDDEGHVRQVTLMLRPHAAMMLAIKRMAAALEQDPPPV